MKSIQSLFRVYIILLASPMKVSFADSDCSKKLGGDGDLTDVFVPEKDDVISSFMDTWSNTNVKGYVAYGRYVFMSDVYDGMVRANHPVGAENLREDQNFQLRIKADTFVCDKPPGGPSEYKLLGVEKFEVIVREVIGKDCHINFLNPDRPPVKPITTRNGDSATSVGGSGKRGFDGEKGMDGRQTEIVLSYGQSSGKMKITAKGGKGGDASPGTKGGDGFRGKNGKSIRKQITDIPCRTRKGSPGKNGGSGGDGGVGGKGGNAGNSAKVDVMTPDGEVGKLSLEIAGCKGEVGKGGKGGAGGKGGKGGIGGQGFHYTLKGNFDKFYCAATGPFKAAYGRPGNAGSSGGNGRNGDVGDDVSISKKKLDSTLYDEGILQLSSGQGDIFYLQRKTEKASSIYNFIKDTSDEGEIKKYSSIMISRLESNLNFFGFSDDMVVAEDVENIGRSIVDALELAKDISKSIDDKIYKSSEIERGKQYYQAIIDSFKENNKGLFEETDEYIKTQLTLKNKVLQSIGEMELRLAEVFDDFDTRMRDAVTRKRAHMISEMLKSGLTLVNPDITKLPQYFKEAIDLGWKIAPCKGVFSKDAIGYLQKTAEIFPNFKTKPVWKEINLSNLNPRTTIILKQATTQKNMNELKASLFCLLNNNGPPGGKLKAALDTYLSYAMKRLQAIGEVYEIDRLTTKYAIRKRYLEKRNTELDKIFERGDAAASAGDVESRLRTIADLQASFREAEGHALQTIYIYADSLRFHSLWKFTDCLTFYTPPAVMLTGASKSFDGYTPLQTVKARLMFYKRTLETKKNRESSQQFTSQQWLYDLNEENSPDLIKSLQSTKTGTFYFDEKDACYGDCSNSRLVKIYAEAVFVDASKQSKRSLQIIIEHFGDNKFFIGKRDTEPIVLKQNKLLQAKIIGKVRDQLLKPCDDRAKACVITEEIPETLFWKACTLRSKKTMMEKRSSPTNDPCRSPFATYAIKIPSGGGSYNPAGTLSNIKGIRVLFAISQWTNYPKDPGGCPGPQEGTEKDKESSQKEEK